MSQGRVEGGVRVEECHREADVLKGERGLKRWRGV